MFAVAATAASALPLSLSLFHISLSLTPFPAAAPAPAPHIQQLRAVVLTRSKLAKCVNVTFPFTRIFPYLYFVRLATPPVFLHLALTASDFAVSALPFRSVFYFPSTLLFFVSCPAPWQML